MNIKDAAGTIIIVLTVIALSFNLAPSFPTPRDSLENCANGSPVFRSSWNNACPAHRSRRRARLSA